MLLGAGVSLAQSLPLAIGGSKNLAVRRAFLAGEQSLLAGHGMSVALTQHSVLPRLWVELVMVGEDNNFLPQTLTNLADAYEKEVENRLTAIMSLMEPMTTFVVGGVVLLMALSMFLPIYAGMEAIAP